MSRAELIGTTRELVYGQGTGERPSLRRAAAAASVTVTGAQAVFTLFAGEGAKVQAGDVLSFLSDNDATKAYVFYVLSVSTDTVTTLNGYRGAPTIANASADLNSGVFEQNPPVTNSEIHNSLDTVFGMLLWPHVFKYGTQTIATPNLGTLQAELTATAMEIVEAIQLDAGIRYQVPHGPVFRNLATPVSSTGVMVNIEYINGSACYLVTKERLIVGDEDVTAVGNKLVRLVSTGAAALALGAMISETALEPGNKESQGASRQTPGNVLWRDFLNLRSQWSFDLDVESKPGFIIRRPG